MLARTFRILMVLMCSILVTACVRANAIPGIDTHGASQSTTLPEASAKNQLLVDAARSQVGVTVGYDAAYVQLDYPGGDVPIETGVCTDVVVRAFRNAGVDLQVVVHEDMSSHFDEYPQRWGLDAPDSNIDHRRVPNLQTYFARQSMAIPATASGGDYAPGDIVTWSVEGRPHIGIVSDTPTREGTRYCVIHNIGGGTRENDFLFRYPITGHYRWE